MSIDVVRISNFKTPNPYHITKYSTYKSPPYTQNAYFTSAQGSISTKSSSVCITVLDVVASSTDSLVMLIGIIIPKLNNGNPIFAQGVYSCSSAVLSFYKAQYKGSVTWFSRDSASFILYTSDGIDLYMSSLQKTAGGIINLQDILYQYPFPCSTVVNNITNVTNVTNIIENNGNGSGTSTVYLQLNPISTQTVVQTPLFSHGLTFSTGINGDTGTFTGSLFSLAHNIGTGTSALDSNYSINGISVLSATALGSGVTNSSLTSVGTLSALNLASGASYQINGTSVLSATTLGSGVTGSSLTSVGTLSALNLASGASYQINGTSVLSATTLGSGVTGSSLTSVGTLNALNLASSASYQINGTSVLSATTLGSGVTGSSLSQTSSNSFSIHSGQSQQIVLDTSTSDKNSISFINGSGSQIDATITSSGGTNGTNYQGSILHTCTSVTATIPPFGSAACFLPPSAYYFQYGETIFPANTTNPARYFFGSATPTTGVGISLIAGYNYEFEMYLPLYTTYNSTPIFSPMIGLGAGSGTFFGSAIFTTGFSTDATATAMTTYTTFLPAGTIGPNRPYSSYAISLTPDIQLTNAPYYYPCKVKGFLNVQTAGTFKPYFITTVLSGLSVPQFIMDNGAYIKIWNLGTNATAANQSSGTWS
jgi:hypothetical protein